MAYALAPERLLYRDALMLVIDKPAGLAVHGGRGPGDNLEKYLDSLRFGLPRSPALAHRLDRDTSGCLALGRNRHALATLGKLFAGGKVEKTYWAIVTGQPPDEGLIDLPLEKKNPDPRNWHMQAAAFGGMKAQTRYRVLGRADGLCWMELQPLTGRTHQLRVHCSNMGWPILGDRIYGTTDDRGLHLHARQLVVPLYKNKPPVSIIAPPPQGMLPSLKACGYLPDAG